jgi:integrase/recombinase XerD
MTILKSLMSYLMDARYTDFNPFLLVKNKRFKALDERAFLVQERILQEHEWQALLQAIENEPENNTLEKKQKNRLRFLVELLFFLGLRIDELARACWHDCKKLDGLWWFFVRGKGGSLGKIPINSQLLEAMLFYRHSIGYAPVPNQEALPLIHGLKEFEVPLSVRQMSNLIKNIACKAAEMFPDDSLSNQKLKRFSPHWLRHLSASYQDQAGISFTNIKSNLRHQNEQTTRIYVHAHDNLRHREMEKLKKF